MNLLLAHNYIKSNKDLLNSINVFPIYDKDTGSNVLHTLDSIKDMEITYSNLEQLASKSLYNARGNSGNILSLFLIGLSQNIDTNLYIMCKRASDFVWDNMHNPKQGTILDAIRCVPNDNNLESFLLVYYNNALNELFLGQDKLDVLKKYNTVDAGTLCFVYILKGLYESVSNKTLDFNITLNPIKMNSDNKDFTYCVEVLSKDHINIDKLEADSLIEIKYNNMYKVHYHTNDYNDILSEKFISLKIDNMKEV